MTNETLLGQNSDKGHGFEMVTYKIVWLDEMATNYIRLVNLLLSPKSDKHQYSPNNINTQSREKVVRINEIIT